MTGFPLLEVKVWGDLACFTRPEMKVERVTYPVMTPSAARGVLQSIFWKPEFRWVVREIHVLNEMRYISFLRNEISSRQSSRTAQNWAQDGGSFSIQDDRTQRHTVALRDVAYVIRAEMDLRPDVTDNIAKYRDQFRRRVQRGQCFIQPYLGCREFTGFFGEPDAGERPVAITGSLGTMLLDLEYDDAKGTGQPRFFDAELSQGVLHVPPMPQLIGAR